MNEDAENNISQNGEVYKLQSQSQARLREQSQWHGAWGAGADLGGEEVGGLDGGGPVPPPVMWLRLVRGCGGRCIVYWL